MKHRRVNVKKLTHALNRAANGKTPTQLAKTSKVDRPRVSRFLNGEFKRMTPVLVRLCKSLRIDHEEFLIERTSAELSPDLLVDLRRLIGNDPAKAAAATRLVRSLVTLAASDHK